MNGLHTASGAFLLNRPVLQGPEKISVSTRHPHETILIRTQQQIRDNIAPVWALDSDSPRRWYLPNTISLHPIHQ
jgi:hypothetical protein